MACAECDRLNKVEIEFTRRADAAQLRLHAFAPEPPFGVAAANELRGYQLEIEKCRISLEAAQRERKAHRETHALTLSY